MINCRPLRISFGARRAISISDRMPPPRRCRPAAQWSFYETIIDDDRRRNMFGLLMSLNMPIETPGSADYTAAECKEWMLQAGFKTMRSEHLVGPESMVVGTK
jgi:hypothetical protein